VVAIFLALADINELWDRQEFRRNIRTIEDLAGYLACHENGQTFGDLEGDRGVGTFGGSQDHTAILGGQAGKLSIYKYCPVKLEQTIDFPAGWVFAVASSGVVAEKTGAAMEKYNRVSGRVSEILQKWNRQAGRNDKTLYDAVHSAPGADDAIRTMLPWSELRERFEQFIVESETIVPRAAGAIASADHLALGKLVDRSQKLAETHLGNQTPQTQLLARSARELGAIAASAFGAGFGGSVWAIVNFIESREFLDCWAQAYRREMPEAAGKAQFFTTLPGSAACRLEVS
jgi:galactokinase